MAVPGASIFNNGRAPQKYVGRKGLSLMLDYRRETEDRRAMVGDLSRGMLIAWAAAGTLDILSAFVFGWIKGVGPGQILRYVASGPFGDSMRDGQFAAAVIGLGVHYALMALMVSLFFIIASRVEIVRRHWPVSGPLYGIAIYLVMYWIVVPARFGTTPKTDLWSVGNALFSHIVCVGLPIAYIAARSIGRSPVGGWQMSQEPAAPESA